MIVLASKSPRRKEILKALGYDFIVCPALKDEVFQLLYRQIQLCVWMIRYWVSQNQKRMR